MGLPLANYHGELNKKIPNCLFVFNWTDGGKLAKFPMRDFQCYVRLPMCRGISVRCTWELNKNTSIIIYIATCTIYICVCTNHALLVIIMSKNNPTNSSHISIWSKQNILALIEIVFELLHHASEVSSIASTISST